jgi:ABC-2 type transport system permease protein
VSRSGFIAVREERDAGAARSEVANGNLSAAIVIPAGFSAAVRSNQAASLWVIRSADAPISAQIARSIAEGFVADLNRVRLAIVTVMASGRAASPEELLSRAVGAPAPVTTNDVSTTTKQLDTRSFYAAGMAVFFVFFTVGLGVTGMLEERADGTLARLAAAPIPRASILAGKLLTSLVLGVMSMAVLVLATTILLGAAGNAIGVAALVLAAVFSAMGIMALIVTVAKTPEQAGSWQSIVAIILGLVGGTFIAVSQGPVLLRRLSLFTPQAWFMRGLGDLRGGAIGSVGTPVLHMLVIAAVTGAVALVRLARTAEVG